MLRTNEKDGYLCAYMNCPQWEMKRDRQFSIVLPPIAEREAGSGVLLSLVAEVRGGTTMMEWTIVIMMSVLLGETALSVVE
jgi:hypothetical protein